MSSSTRSQLFQFRVTPQERARIEANAQAAGMKASAWVRYRALTDPSSDGQTRALYVEHLVGLENALAKARQTLSAPEEDT